ncbi:MAG TPA: zinc ABC transporter substrate-binding protein [Acidimicrobiales bacterium]|nr:zinc ABC transporter substrate-binding protein [Acidimicrobiales bacterium]
MASNLFSALRVSLVSALVVGAGLVSVYQPSPAGAASGKISIVAAENEYGNVAMQIGGKYVSVTSIESNPNTDPHDYEVTPAVPAEISSAQIVIQNGVGYDSWINTIEKSAPNPKRDVISAQALLGFPTDTPNPHLWYNDATMPDVAAALVTDLSKIEPSHASYFAKNETKFLNALKPWYAAIANFAAKYFGTPVASTEPVSDYLLEAMGIDNMTHWTLQADIMNNVDPTPQDVSYQQSLFSKHLVKVFVYNQQVTDALTASFIVDAKKAHIPVVGVYETMPTPGYSYQSWMLAETQALTRAVKDGTSTQKL